MKQTLKLKFDDKRRLSISCEDGLSAGEELNDIENSFNPLECEKVYEGVYNILNEFKKNAWK